MTGVRKGGVKTAVFLLSLLTPGPLLVVATYVFFNGRPLTLFAGLGLTWVGVVASIAVVVMRLAGGR